MSLVTVFCFTTSFATGSVTLDSAIESTANTKMKALVTMVAIIQSVDEKCVCVGMLWDRVSLSVGLESV